LSETAKPKRVIEISVPDSCVIDSFPVNSYSFFIQNLPLSDSNSINAHNGNRVSNPIYRVLAVINLPLLFKDDLEQCADFAMRFWAEYHKSHNLLSDLYLFNYNGTKKYYRDSNQKYHSFLRSAFAYANSYSLKKGCKKISAIELQPGDLIVQNTDGGIGHVSVILNSCKNKAGKHYYLIGYSFMPAQEFHIEHAMKYGKKGWFTIDGYYEFLKDHLDLGEPVLRRF
jgi:hypothetical protein